MLRVFWTSKSSMMANAEKMDVISNNLANTNTEGYKKLEVSFKDLVNESLERNGYPTSKNNNGQNASYTGTGIKASEWTRDNTQGELTPTGINSDFAIEGAGYFGVTKPDNTSMYIRAGKFELDGSGSLVDSKGNKLNIDFENGYNYNNVKFSKSNYVVKENGDVVITSDNKSNIIGKIPLYDASGERAFKSIGENYYAPNDNVTVYKVNNSVIHQGYSENSNVDVGEEMAQMIVTQRAFELGSKGIKAADDMWGMANNLRK